MIAPAVPYECDSCPTTCTPVQVPGTPGTDGTNGTPGATGANAYTQVTTGFVMPVIGNTENVEVGNTAWMVPEQGGVGGQVVTVEFAGTLVVEAIIDGTNVTLRNDGYAENAAPGTAIPALAKVGVGGRPGDTGVAPGGALIASNNLSDVDNPVTSRGNLGLGTAATLNLAQVLQSANNLADLANALAARTNLGVAIGADVQAFSAFLAGLVAAGPGAANQAPYLTAANTFALYSLTAAMRTLLGSASNAALLAALKVLPREGLLGSLIGADMDVTTDQPIPMSSSRFRVTRIVVTNASVNLTTAQGGVYNAGGKPGAGVLVANTQVYTALTAPAKFVDLTLAGVALTDVQTATLQFSLTVAQGAVSTADVYVFGEDLS